MSGNMTIDGVVVEARIDIADKKRSVQIVDQTLLTIASTRQSEQELWRFVEMLRRTGADILEIDDYAMKRLCKRFEFEGSEEEAGTEDSMSQLLLSLSFAYRVSNPFPDFFASVPYEIRKTIKFLIFPIDIIARLFENKRGNNGSHLFDSWSGWCSRQGMRIIVEVPLESFSQWKFPLDRQADRQLDFQKDGILDAAHYSYEQICDYVTRAKAEVLRIKGLERNALPFDFNQIQKLQRELGVEVEICAGNAGYMATALAVEAIKSGAGYVTTSFAGGKGSKAAAFEEVVMAKTLLLNLGTNGENFSLLQRMTEVYQRLTGTATNPMKPITGSDIFHYESGIHAAGMMKNHAIYEPYPPEMVGKRRELLLGKHTGSYALHMKLRQWDIDVSPEMFERLLESLRSLSVEWKRGLLDREVLALVRGTIYGANRRHDIT